MFELVEVAVPCSVCKNKISVKVSKQPSIFNLLNCTAIVLEHPGTITCPNCSSTLVVMVAGVQNLMLTTAPVPAALQPRIVIPGVPM